MELAHPVHLYVQATVHATTTMTAPVHQRIVAVPAIFQFALVLFQAVPVYVAAMEPVQVRILVHVLQVTQVLSVAHGHVEEL